MTGNREPAASPQIRVGNIQRVIPVNAINLEKFATKAVRRCLALHKAKDTKLTKLREIFVWLISDFTKLVRPTC